MNAPATMTTCPTEETLAAFIDGRLAGDARKRVVEHLATCSECRDVALAASEIEANNAASLNVTKFHPRPWRTAAWAAAASILIIAALPALREWLAFKRTGGLTAVLSAYNTMSVRTVQPRLSGGFAFKEFKKPVRGNEDTHSIDDRQMWPMLEVASKLERTGPNRSWKELRALAVAQLLTGDRDEAVRTMERAAASGGSADPGFLSDLAAVYLERSRWSGNPQDANRAFDAAERAWQRSKTPETAWNRALAYEQKGQDMDAVRAWKEYLKLETGSQWAKEAREDHIERLQNDGSNE